MSFPANLLAIVAIGRMGDASAVLVDPIPLLGGEPSDAGEHATWLFGDGSVSLACRLIRNVLAATMRGLFGSQLLSRSRTFSPVQVISDIASGERPFH